MKIRCFGVSGLAVAVVLIIFPVTPALAIDNVFADTFQIRLVQDCPECPPMVIVPAGTFLMGSPKEEQERHENEGPQRAVSINRFALGQTSITVAQWNACAAHGGCPFSIDVPDDTRLQHPATGISWHDAQLYVEWISQKTGIQYRLPSEAEYEYATRAGTTGRFYTGDCITADDANFYGPDPAVGCPEGVYLVDTTPVRTFPANPWGLYDIVGNTQDWVQDCWNDNYGGAPTDGSAWLEGQCHLAALKGAAWHIEGRYLRSANRNSDPKDLRFYATGFRVARSIEPSVFKDCPECPTMVALPSGSFLMGSPDDEPERDENEGPQRTVSINRFALGQTSITVAQWNACAAQGGCPFSIDVPDDTRLQHPATGISWHDAQLYVEWISQKTGIQYRLPSEAEYEYATRAGTTCRFYTGDCITTDDANFYGPDPAVGCPEGVYLVDTTPVKTYPANPWGLYDMVGNTQDWVQDCWNDNYVGAPTDGSAWMEGQCDLAALKGGAWHIEGRYLRSANRNSDPKDLRFYATGFRVARSLNP